MRVIGLIISALLGLAFVGGGLIIMAFGGLCAERDVATGIGILLVGGFVIAIGVFILWLTFLTFRPGPG